MTGATGLTCILIVEDERMIRELVMEFLIDEGFKVFGAETGEAAASLIQTPTAFALLMTDIHMPGPLDGLAVARLMRARHPGAPIIYMTGRPDALNSLGPLGDNEVLVQKPFSLFDLMRTAHDLLTHHAD